MWRVGDKPFVSVFILSAIMLNVIMLSVVAPSKMFHGIKI
jgi:hypothetical protein